MIGDLGTASRTQQEPYLHRILRAQVYDVAEETPLERAPRLSKRLGTLVLLKREDLQPVFSFKLRGAYNKMRQLSAAERLRGVVCASAGNHAQGVALAGRRLGVRTVIVMPQTTPRIKVQAVADLGGEIVLFGDDFDAAFAHARQLGTQQGLCFVHPFDDPDVIAGQGTIGMEILRQRPGDELDAVFLPIGGGGLAAGVAAYIKALYPHVRLIGVEPRDAACMKAALEHGGPVRLPRVGAFADGAAVREAGTETHRLLAQYLDDLVLVDTDEICAAIQDGFEDTRVLLEPAGALALAGLKRYVQEHGPFERAAVAVLSGANMNFDRLRHVAERADIGADRELLLAVTIPEQPGSFRNFCALLGQRSVTEFNYRYADQREAQIFVGLSIEPNGSDRRHLVDSLEAGGFPVTDLSQNEMAKLHVRYMVGGRAPELHDERLFRFEFPERKGALLKFLDAIGHHWNISLFHYRNHGSDYGRVLAGIQVPAQDATEFDQHLQELGYAFTEETANPAYRAFL
ncbi:MAG: threonine ammonia-lyase, biosynthetic [Ahniella sp.]|nr:threonine ammonia-lyase, biosynthetic [Ahniella sp.]